MLANPLDDFLAVPGHVFELFLVRCVTINPKLNAPEDHFHENGLRTNPPAENPSECHGEHNDEHHHCNHTQQEVNRVLWPENLAQDHKFPFEDVHQ